MATDHQPPRQAGDIDSRPTVITVLGPVPADSLGFTSMHEHVLCDATVYRRKSERTDPAAYAALLDGFPDAERLEHAPVSLETVGLCRSLYTLQLRQAQAGRPWSDGGGTRRLLCIRRAHGGGDERTRFTDRCDRASEAVRANRRGHRRRGRVVHRGQLARARSRVHGHAVRGEHRLRVGPRHRRHGCPRRPHQARRSPTCPQRRSRRFAGRPSAPRWKPVPW